MPIIWRYLLKQYWRVFFLTTVSFVLVLLVTRLKEIAKFAALGSDSQYVLRFVCYLIPYILPIAIPIACLIAAILLTQKLSLSHEITAMRSLGLSLNNILTPILLSAFFLSICNFYIVSELTTFSHMSSRRLIHNLTNINPLFLLQNRQLLKQRDVFIDVQDMEKGRNAHGVTIIALDKKHQKLNLFTAEKLEMQGLELIGSNVSIASHLDNKPQPNDFDNLVIENQKTMQMSAQDLSQLMKKSGWRLSNDYFQLSQLLIRIYDLQQRLKEAIISHKPPNDINWLKMHLSKCYSEIFRRFSIALSVFSFTFLGLAYGLSISRQKSKKGVLMVVLLAAIALTCFFGAKSLDSHYITASMLYFMPHVILVFFSLGTIFRLSRGIE